MTCCLSYYTQQSIDLENKINSLPFIKLKRTWNEYWDLGGDYYRTEFQHYIKKYHYYAVVVLYCLLLQVSDCLPELFHVTYRFFIRLSRQAIGN